MTASLARRVGEVEDAFVEAAITPRDGCARYFYRNATAVATDATTPSR